MEVAQCDTQSRNSEATSPTSPKGKQNLTSPSGNDALQDTCVICLSAISERAVAVPCNHLNFDFLCLVSWLQEQSTCPLCKTAITSVQYDWRAPDDFKTYATPSPSTNASSAPPTPALAWQRGRPVNLRAARAGASVRRTFQPYRPTTPGSINAALARRRLVYTRQTYSLHTGSNRVSHFADFTPVTFARSPELQARARVFIRRELRVFSFLQDTSRVEFLLEYVVGILKKLEIKGSSGAAEDLVAEFLGRDNAKLFLHELEAWLKSPFAKVEDWDRHVQYAGSRTDKVGVRTAEMERTGNG